MSFDYELNMIKKAARVVLVWVLSTMLAIVLEKWGIRVENLLLIYMVGVLISIVETSSMLWGAGTSVVFVLTFNFLFTDPKLTFAVDDPNYLISFVIFITVAFIVSTLMVKLQKQMKTANTKTEITTKINEIGSDGQTGGNMEGKETRFGIAASATWAVFTTAASNGSVNSMHDSYTPIGGMIPMLLMMLGEVVFGGTGCGLYGMLALEPIAEFFEMIA